MKGWRARIGFLVPPGNPTVEPEMFELAPRGVSVHFTRMTAHGAAGTHDGQDERNRSQIESIDPCLELLAMVSPNVIVMAHTATSYMLGEAREPYCVARIIVSSLALGANAATTPGPRADQIAGHIPMDFSAPLRSAFFLPNSVRVHSYAFFVIGHEEVHSLGRHTPKRGCIRSFVGQP